MAWRSVLYIQTHFHKKKSTNLNSNFFCGSVMKLHRLTQMIGTDFFFPPYFNHTSSGVFWVYLNKQLAM